MTAIAATFLALAVVPGLAGLPVRRTTNGIVAWVFGFVVIAMTFAVLHALQVPRALAYGAPILVAVAGGILGRARDTVAAPLPRLWIAMMAGLAVCAGLNTAWLPVDEWDAVAIWYAKARGIMEWTPLAELPFPTYPTLAPSAWALLLPIAGLDKEPLARLVFPAVTVAWMASVPVLLPTRVLRPHPAIVVLLFAVAVASFDFAAATSGYQDLLVASIGGLAAILLGRTLLDPRGLARAHVVLAFVFAGCLGMIKAEGAFLGAIIVSTWIVAFAATHGINALIAVLPRSGVVAYATLLATWPVLASVAQIEGWTSVQAHAFDDVSLGRLLQGLTRLPLIGSAMVSMTPTYSLVFLSAAAISAGAVRAVPWTRPILCWLWSIAAIHLAAIVCLFLVTNVDPVWHLNTALVRLISQHTFVWLLALSIGTVALIDG